MRLSLTCHIRIDQTGSKRSIARAEAIAYETPFRQPSSIGYHRTMEPSFSFGRLKPPTIGNENEHEPRPEESDREEKKHVFESPPPKKTATEDR